MKLGLRDVEYFAVVADHGNVGRAAESLGLSQPALSRSLRRLETAIQAQLFARTPKGVELTAVGSALLSQVRRLRLAVDDVAREAADLSRGLAGHLRIGASPVTTEHLGGIYATLRKQAPRLTLQITAADSDVTLPLLRKGGLDLIVNYLPTTPHEGTVQERLFDEEWVVFASSYHWLADRRRVTLRDLVQEQWTLSVPSLLNVRWLYRAFEDRGLPPPRVAIEVRTIRPRLQICASTDLLSFTSRRILREAAPSYRLKEIPVKELTLRRTVGVIQREGGYLSPTARRFIEILKATAREVSSDRKGS
jgi:DNA-binding transcriptional LysR family regulator